MKLSQVIRNLVPENCRFLIPSRHEEVGDICLLKLPEELSDFYSVIGEAVLENFPQFKVVAVRTGRIKNEQRVGEIKVIAGENRTETEHREYGCRYKLDLGKVFFTPRLSYEHNRVANLVREGEVVLNMFSGIGTFSILIAKRVKNCKVFSVDINPQAIEYLKKNILLNGVQDKVIAILGDAAKIEETVQANRIIMPLPLRAYEYLEIAAHKIIPGGTIHYYDTIFAEETKIQQLNNLSEKVRARLEDLKLEIKIPYKRRIRSLTPGFYLSVLDILVLKKN
ncbi:MAG: class I SAM-dependent methyltransferase [Candidatus Jordarchaeum sp.]|uniref:class I SAM-dependent methyltransferase n=1 Tax=Candidatus Jordarchaeum sp. TaxID=2823881 RepID=UPI0040498729